MRRRWLMLSALALACLVCGVGVRSLLESEPANVEARVISGTPAKKMTDSSKVQRWRRPSITVHIDERVAKLGPDALLAVERAFATWSESGAPTVNFRLDSGLSAPMEPDGINAVVVGPVAAPGHENDLAVTVGFSDTETGEIVEADVIINPAYPIRPLLDQQSQVVQVSAEREAEDDDPESEPRPATGPARDTYGTVTGPSCNGDTNRGRTCGERYDLESIVAHEAGHFFGLGEDDDDALATMYFCTSTCETHKRSLEPTDKDTMREVYANGFPEESEVRCSTASVGATQSMYWMAAAVLWCMALLTGARRAERAKTTAPSRRRRRVPSAKERT